MKHGLLSIILSLASLVLAPAAGAQTATQTYRDWSVTCSNIKTCMAYSTSTQSEGGLAARPRGIDDNVGEGWMTIERAAGPGSVATILLSRPDASVSNIPANSEIHLVGSNGRPVPRGIFAATLGRRDAIEIAPSLNVAFMGAARNASHALLVVGAQKRKVFYVSLSGLVAAGRAIDARQGRTNTVGAMIDVGRNLDVRVPSAPALPIVSVKPFTLRANATPPAVIVRRRITDCDDAERFDPGARGIKAYDLANGRTLWSVHCGAGSYNTWNRLYIQSASNVIDAARFSDVPGKEGEEQQGLVNAVIDPSKGTITAFSKSRGMGDCGDTAIFAWTGVIFEIIQATEMVPCGGIVPQFWPSVYQAQAVWSARP